MVFSSAIFLFAFLPIVFTLYLLPFSINFKNALLIAASILFYSFGEPVYVLLMIASTAVNYMFGKLIVSTKGNKIINKSILISSIILNIGVLCLFKYLCFIINTINTIFCVNLYVPQIALPIGISFFTFQALSYVIDVYRNGNEQKNFFHLLLYISFFPQLIAGPIIRYHDIEPQLKKRNSDTTLIVHGIQRFIKGLFKKLFFANCMGYIADKVFSLNISEYSFLVAWLGAVCYTLQIYYDFSGYSDMAIGLANMFGFNFKENFEHPYSADSLKNFWHKWHISLSTWFKEYVYIPLGGSRNGLYKTERNKLIVFLLTGIWHGANFTFIIWGLIHGIVCVMEDTILPIKKVKSKIIKNIYTWLIVTTTFVIFRSNNVLHAFNMLKAMFTNLFVNMPSISFLGEQLNTYNIFLIIIGIILAYPISGIIKDKLQKTGNIYNALITAESFLMLILCIINMASATYNPFIYFRF